MLYRESDSYSEKVFRRKLSVALAWVVMLFLCSAIMLTIEIFCLLGLQYCDGEDLMSLYWSTWTMLQMGSEIAIVGIVLALWHHLWDVQHPYVSFPTTVPPCVVASLRYAAVRFAG
jgi:hypothetical protein